MRLQRMALKAKSVRIESDALACARPREGGDPALCARSWIPAFAGMSGKLYQQDRALAQEDARREVSSRSSCTTVARPCAPSIRSMSGVMVSQRQRKLARAARGFASLNRGYVCWIWGAAFAASPHH